MKKILFAASLVAASTLPVWAGELKLKSLQVDNPLKAGIAYEVRLPYTKIGNVKVRKGCFTWSGEGPYCFDVNVRTQTIRTKLRTGNPGKYRLGGYIEYSSDGKKLKSNTVYSQIDVRSKQAAKSNTNGPKIVSEKADIECAQQGLLNAGFDPNGVDGAIGNGTKKAAGNYKAEKAKSLDDLSMASVAEWCRHFSATNSIPESKIAAGTYKAVFSSGGTNRCGMLSIDYAKGHFYQTGICSDDRSKIKEGSDVWQTGLVSVGDEEISVLSAKYDLLEIKPDMLTGSWTLAGSTNPVLVFRKVGG